MNSLATDSIKSLNSTGIEYATFSSTAAVWLRTMAGIANVPVAAMPTPLAVGCCLWGRPRGSPSGPGTHPVSSLPRMAQNWARRCGCCRAVPSLRMMDSRRNLLG